MANSTPSLPNADNSDLDLPPLNRLPHLVIENSRGREVFLLTADRYTIGRSPRCDICLDSPFISGYHATLLREGNTYRLLDGRQGKPSKNGLSVNGRIIHDWLLRGGELVTFGTEFTALYHKGKTTP